MRTASAWPIRLPLAALVAGTLAVLAAAQSRPAPGTPPALGDPVRDFTLRGLDGQPLHLAALTRQGPVVLIFLRGWVGYQCPICQRQVGDFIAHGRDFQGSGASVVLVYPGAADLVQEKAQEFVAGKTLPERFHLAVDPELKVVNLYGVRWDAPKETAYPSTFVIDTRGTIRFVKISRSHGDRSTAQEVLQVLSTLQGR